MIYRSLTLRSAVSGEIRTAQFDGKDHVVIPVTALVEGVIQAMNAPNPELVLADRFSVAPSGWNGRPVFLNHPLEGGQPISGNSPEVLATSFGRVFNSMVSDKRLLMEAWIDEERATELGGEAAELLPRVRAGKSIEISTGAFIVLASKKGTWTDGKRYNGVWETIIPDHLAILSEGSTGACSYEMGCGVRAASAYEVTKRGLVALYKGEPVDANKPVKNPSMLKRFAQFVGLMNPDEMGDVDLRDALRDALGKVNPDFRWNGDVVIVYPQIKRVVYLVYDPEGIDYYSQTYELNTNGVATLTSDPVECERVTTYVPMPVSDDAVTAAIQNVVALAGARHSKSDQSMVQTMHDTSVSLGADCASVKASEGSKEACGCGARAATAQPPAAW